MDDLTCELPSGLTVKEGAERGVEGNGEETGQARIGGENSLSPIALGQCLEASGWAQGIIKQFLNLLEG